MEQNGLLLSINKTKVCVKLKLIKIILILKDILLKKMLTLIV